MGRLILIIVIFIIQTKFTFGIETKWWEEIQTYYHPNIESSEDLYIEKIQSTNSTIVSRNPYICIGYGFNDLFDYNRGMPEKLNQELKKKGYFKTFFLSTVQAGEFLVETDKTGQYIILSPWTKDLPSNKSKTKQYGFKSFYNDEPINKLVSWSDFFPEKWKFPDGKIVKNPYDLAAKGIFGDKKIWRTYKTDKKGNPLAYTYEMDVCNPYWLEYCKKASELLIDFGADGIHLDEFNADNMTFPDEEGFGVWSLAEFSRFLTGDIKKFNLIKYLFKDNIPFEDEKWKRDSIWQKYVNFKRDFRVEFNRELVKHIKEYGKLKGKEIAIMANSPSFFAGAGKSQKEVDLLESELKIFQHNEYDKTNLTLSDRLSGWIKIQLATSGKDFTLVCPEFQDEVKNNPNYMRLFLSELSANRASITLADDMDSRVKREVVKFHKFILNNKELFEKRRSLAKVAMIYSDDMILKSTTIKEASTEYQNNFTRWVNYLSMNQIQYDVLTEEELSNENINKYDLVIIPGSEKEKKNVEIIYKLINFKGKIINDKKMIYPPTNSDSPILSHEHKYDFKDGEKGIEELIRNNIDSDLIIDKKDTNLEINIYYQKERNRILICLHNHNYLNEKDSIIKIENLKFSYKLPVFFKGTNKKIRVVSPDEHNTDENKYHIEDGKINFEVKELLTYKIIVIE